VGHNKVYLNLGGKDENGKPVSNKDPVLELLLN